MIPLTGHQGCVVALVVAVALSGWAGWAINGWRLDSRYETLQRGIAESHAKALTKARSAEQSAVTKVADLSNKLHAAEAINAQLENDRDTAIAAGTQRVYVRATCPSLPADAATTAGSDAPGPELDPAYRSALSDLRRAARDSAEQIAALQEYASACHLLTTQAH